MLSRRQFLGLGGGAAAVAVGGTAAWRALVDARVQEGSADQPTPSSTSSSSTTPHTAGRVLVVVQLAGGNDGLNTLVPLGDGRYHDHRPSLGVAEGRAVGLGGQSAYGLHPALGALAPWWERGRLAAVDGVGFPDQSRSHFAALDTWWRGTTDRSVHTGWLGRWLDAVGDPTDALRAVALGSGSPALVGDDATATVVLDPAGFALRTPKGADVEQLRDAFLTTAAPFSADPTMVAAQQAVPSTLDAVAKLQPAMTDDANAGRDDRDASTLLDVAARIIGLQIGTEVIVVTVGGYDTHANQAQAHPTLLRDLAAGLDGFLAQIDAQGRADDVLVLTTSEFGRRVAENGSGTDHGEASVQFLAGGPLAEAQVVGQADLGRLDDGDLPIAIDTRSLYAEALDWLGGPTDEILGGRYDRLGLVSV